jgi:hypothetical protein
MNGAHPRATVRALLNRPAYRRLWLARTTSHIGDVAQFTTLSQLLFSLTGSGLGVSGAVVAEILPALLLAPLAGSLMDRLPRVQVMVGADLVRVLLAGMLALRHDHTGRRTRWPSGCPPGRSSSAQLRSPSCRRS